MVQALHDRRRSGFDVAVVDEIPLHLIDLAFNDYIEAKRMPMQPPALVAVGKRRQIVGCFKMEGLAQANVHRVAILGIAPKKQIRSKERSRSLQELRL